MEAGAPFLLDRIEGNVDVTAVVEAGLFRDFLGVGRAGRECDNERN